MRNLAIDIETYSSVDITKSGAYKYVESEDFRILLFAYAFDDEPVRIVDLECGESLPDDVIKALDFFNGSDVRKTAYNAQFEMLALSKYLSSFHKSRVSLDCIRSSWIRQWECTMLLGQYYGYPGSLRLIGEAMGFREDQKKFRTGNALIKLFCSPNKNGVRNLPSDYADEWQMFKEYCVQDVVTEREVRRHLPEMPERLRREWITDWQCFLRGVRIDADLVASAQRLVEIDNAKKLKLAKELTGLENPNSPSQLKCWLEEESGLVIDSLSKKKVSEMLEKFKDGKIAKVLRLRQELGKTSTAKYPALLRGLCKDGRVRGILQFYGAGRTGRWAGRLVQVQNLPQNHLDNLRGCREGIKNLHPLSGEPVINQLSQLIRTVFIPSDGCRFAVADFSAIEARVIAWLAGENWREEVFSRPKSEGGGKIYETSAAMMFKVPVETIVKGHENYALRQKGKIAELALGYGGGLGAMRAMGAKPEDFTDEEILDIISKWRKASPNIEAMWSRLEYLARSAVSDEYEAHDAMRTGVKNLSYIRMDYFQTKSRKYRYASGELKDKYLFNILSFRRRANPRHGGQHRLEITLPSGRCLNYVNFHVGEFEKKIVAKSGAAYVKTLEDALVYDSTNQMTKKWGRLETYGGKLAENIVQAIARDCLMETISRLESAGFKIVMHIHDEVVVEVKAEEAELKLAEILDIMRKPIEWAPGLVLDADGFTEDFYKKD